MTSMNEKNSCTTTQIITKVERQITNWEIIYCMQEY